MIGYVDFAFWWTFLPPLIGGGVAGWWLRGVKVADDTSRWDKDLLVAKKNHPAYRQRWTWDD